MGSPYDAALLIGSITMVLLFAVCALLMIGVRAVRRIRQDRRARAFAMATCSGDGGKILSLQDWGDHRVRRLKIPCRSCGFHHTNRSMR